jgi:mRNA interferase MazF
MHKRDIVLIPFPFTDLSGNKVRPALVLAVPERGADCIVAFVTSNKEGKSVYGVEVEPDAVSGIKASSLIRLDKIATLQKSLVLGELGKIDSKKMKQVDIMIKKVFGL